MTTMMSHRNHQSYDAGRFVRSARRNMAPKRRAERQVERVVFAMVACLSGLAFWTAADTLDTIPPGIVAAAPAASPVAGVRA